MAQRSDLQPVDHRPAVSAGSGCLAKRCAASHPDLHPGQLDGVAALELEAAGGLTTEVDRRAMAVGRRRTTRNHHTLTPEWEPWGSPHAYEKSVLPSNSGFYNVCSAFEVFEHLPNPVATIKQICDKCSSDKLIILIGTGSHDLFVNEQKRLSWWYAAPRNGHISLYSRVTLKLIGDMFGLSYISFSSGTHLLFRGWAKAEVAFMLLRGKSLHKIQSVFKSINSKTNV